MGHMGRMGRGSAFGPPRGLMDRYGFGQNYGLFGPPVMPEIILDPYDPNDPFGCDPIAGRRNYFGDDGDDQGQSQDGGAQPDGSDASQPQDDGSGGSGGVLDAVQQVASGVADMIAPPAGPSAGQGPGPSRQYMPPPPPPQYAAPGPYAVPAYPHHHHHHRHIAPQYIPPPPAYIPPPMPRENVWRHMADYRDRRFERREPYGRHEPYGHPGYAPSPFEPVFRPAPPFARGRLW